MSEPDWTSNGLREWGHSLAGDLLQKERKRRKEKEHNDALTTALSLPFSLTFDEFFRPFTVQRAGEEHITKLRTKDLGSPGQQPVWATVSWLSVKQECVARKDHRTFVVFAVKTRVVQGKAAIFVANAHEEGKGPVVAVPFTDWKRAFEACVTVLLGTLNEASLDLLQGKLKQARLDPKDVADALGAEIVEEQS